MGRTRKPLALAAVCLLVLALSGCVTINSTSTSQPQSMGALTLAVAVCANGSPGCSGLSNTGSVYSFLQSSMDDSILQMQQLVGVRLPEGATPPDQLTGQVSGGGTLTFTRSASYEAELQALEPAPAGERWWGWLSSQRAYSRNTAQSYSVAIQTTLPRPAGDGPLPSPMRWRPVVGARIVDMTPPALTANRAVDCGTTNQHLYDGHNERNPGTLPATIACVDAPAADAARGFLEAPLTDFGVVGTDLTAPPGSTVTATFLARRSGAADPGTSFALAVAGGPPAGTVTIDRTSVSLGGDSTIPVLATVAVPPDTPPGDYPITLAASAAGKPTRTGTAVLTVPAPPPPASDASPPVIRNASLTRRRFRAGRRATPLTGSVSRTPAGTTLRVALSEAATLAIDVERVRRGRRSGGPCSPTARAGRRCTIVKRAARLTRRLPAGASKVRFSGRLGRRRLALAAGAYRLRLVASDAAGNRSATRMLSFTIVAR